MSTNPDWPDAKDLLDLNLETAELEKERLSRLIAHLPRLALPRKDDLNRRLIGIATCPVETLLRRVQAASMLGFQCRRLGLAGSTTVATSLAKSIETEFFELAGPKTVEGMNAA